jgi:hypothetical protein
MKNGVAGPGQDHGHCPGSRNSRPCPASY